jgi:hypothetical protein
MKQRSKPVKTLISALALFAAGALAAAFTGARADELQVSKFRYPQPVEAKILVCPATVAPADCDARNAFDVIAGPPSASDIGCGVQSEEMLAGTGIRMRDGQYIKIACARATAQAN